jgi:hypothetical protein
MTLSFVLNAGVTSRIFINLFLEKCDRYYFFLLQFSYYVMEVNV